MEVMLLGFFALWIHQFSMRPYHKLQTWRILFYYLVVYLFQIFYYIASCSIEESHIVPYVTFDYSFDHFSSTSGFASFRQSRLSLGRFPSHRSLKQVVGKRFSISATVVVLFFEQKGSSHSLCVDFVPSFLLPKSQHSSYILSSCRSRTDKKYVLAISLS